MNLLFRTDASLTIGTGHVMRCLALAQAWQDAGGRALFAMAEATPTIQARLTAESCQIFPFAPLTAGTVDDSLETVTLAREQQATWIVVDGYQFGADYQLALKLAGFKVLFLDDYGHARYYSADLVLDQNVGASEALYIHRETPTRLLLGPRYCLLRREFAPWRDWKRKVSSVGRRVLVMMGGSDPGNLTARVMDALKLVRCTDMEVTVVVGGSNPHFTMLRKAAAQSGRKITIKRDVSNVAELMAGADVAVSAAGSTCWELCLLGLPALLVDVADNQTVLAREMNKRGCAIHVGDRTFSTQNMADNLGRLLNSRDLRHSSSQRSRELVDGSGARRVVSFLHGAENLQLRRARPEDSRLLWEWANDPEVRWAAFSSAPIPWETHAAWFAEKLSQERSLLFIAENGEKTPCGQIRFDGKSDGDWEVDVSVAKVIRGGGVAGWLIKLGVQAILDLDHTARVHAFVKAKNVASVRAFENAEFKRIGIEQIRGNTAIHLVYEKNEPA